MKKRIHPSTHPLLAVPCIRRECRLDLPVCARQQQRERVRCESAGCEWVDNERVMKPTPQLAAVGTVAPLHYLVAFWVRRMERNRIHG